MMEAVIETASSSKLGTPFPAAYREQGYLAIVFSEHGEVVEYTRTGDRMEVLRSNARAFLQTYTYVPEVDAVALALNFFSRWVRGFPMNDEVKRRIVAMVDRSALERLNDGVLAREYSKICNVRISSISPDRRDVVIDELLQKLGDSIDTSDLSPEDQQQFDQEQGDDMTATQATTSSKGKKAGIPPKKVKAAPAAKKSEAKAVAPKKATKRASSSAAVEPCSKENPYREGSMKNKAFAIYCKGGDRANIIAQIEKVGTTSATASSWMHSFFKYAASSEVPKAKKSKE